MVTLSNKNTNFKILNFSLLPSYQGTGSFLTSGLGTGPEEVVLAWSLQTSLWDLTQQLYSFGKGLHSI